MSLSDDDLDTLRGYIGVAVPPAGYELEDAYTRLGNVYSVAREVLSKRLGDLLAGPAQFSVSGYSENNSANISALQKQIEVLDTTIGRIGLGPDASVVTSVEFCRPGTVRR